MERLTTGTPPIGGYTILEEIGAGATCQVFQALDPDGNRFALKLTRFGSESVHTESELRLEQEAEVLSRLLRKSPPLSERREPFPCSHIFSS